jgi:hypothetical protein
MAVALAGNPLPEEPEQIIGANPQTLKKLFPEAFGFKLTA